MRRCPWATLNFGIFSGRFATEPLSLLASVRPGAISSSKKRDISFRPVADVLRVDAAIAVSGFASILLKFWGVTLWMRASLPPSIWEF
jgi:hypothetical protein